MSAIGGGGNYISDGDIMAWLALQQNRIYEDLSSSMDLSEQRAHFTDSLNNIKADLEAANKSGKFGKVDGELQDFMTKCGSDPQFQDLCSGLKDMASQIHSDYQVRADYPGKVVQYRKDEQAYDAAQGRQSVGVATPEDLERLARGRPQPPTELPAQGYKDDQLQSWESLIDGKSDVLNKNDQLTMIHIQELKATLDQGAQLGSSFISSGDKTSSAIINNIA